MSVDRKIQQSAMVNSRPAGGPEFIARFNPERVGLLLDVIDAARVVNGNEPRTAPLPSELRRLGKTIAAYDALNKETE